MATSSASGSTVKKRRPVPKKKVSGTSTSPSPSTTDTEVPVTTSAPAKKRVVRKKVAPAKTAPRKAVVKPAPAKKTVAAKKKTSATSKKSNLSPRPTNEHGFVDGTDSAYIAQAFLEGGFDRNDVNAKAEALISENNGLKNRNGGDKYIPSIASSILSRMLETGKYKIEATWKLVETDTPEERRPRTQVVNKRVQEPAAKPKTVKAAAPVAKTRKRPVRRKPAA